METKQGHYKRTYMDKEGNIRNTWLCAKHAENFVHISGRLDPRPMHCDKCVNAQPGILRSASNVKALLAGKF